MFRYWWTTVYIAVVVTLVLVLELIRLWTEGTL